MAKARQQQSTARVVKRRRSGGRRAGNDTARRQGARVLRIKPATLLHAALFVSVSAAVALTGARLLDVPVTQVTMEGPFRRVSYGEVEAVLRAELPAGFLSADLAHLRGLVEGLPWVDVARVRRVWPDGVLVSLTEHQAVARWGEDGLLNSRGELFVRDKRFVLPELPQLDGPPGSEVEVSERYLDYNRQLASMGFELLALSVDARGAWNAQLRGGTANAVEVRLGRRDPDARFRRFVETASGLVLESAERIDYVDMRYGNGFAVGWQETGVADSTDIVKRKADGTES